MAEDTVSWRVPDPGGPELPQASFRKRRFAPHAHDRFALGVIETGSLSFRYRGEEVVAPAGDPLARQAGLGLLVQDVLSRYGTRCFERDPGPGRADLERVKRFLEEASETPVGLADLAALSGMNPYRLVRGFTRAWGLPPHAAADAGFADQSHLNRHFLRRFGVTPGMYAQAWKHTLTAQFARRHH
jgi:AraC-like DNA-binding protein